ncbi:MAG: NTP transferase domain-containing protein [Actinomycetota bacterium]|nr:NTP transferase domain-containing protein [Actinomycetota bacterium]
MSDAAGDTTAVVLAAGRGKRMGSDLPKVLHPLSGRPLVSYAIDNVRAAGADRVVVVVGYRRELVEEALRDSDVAFAVQGEQRGTGHAVLAAREHLHGDGDVLVVYGDMPLLSAATLRRLRERRSETGAAAVALTITLDNPPDFGRIVRNEHGDVVRVVEVRDASPDELAIREVNVGAYCFSADHLVPALERLRSDNAQGEYYLTDVPGILVADGLRVETIATDDLEETLGINDLLHLAFAEKLSDIRYAESLYGLVDAVGRAARKKT